MMLRTRGLWLTALLLVVATCGLARAMPYEPFKRQLPDCGQFANCSTCTAKGGCGWCLRPTAGSLLNGTCTAGENGGPTDPHTCSRWFYQDCHNLEVCEATTCENCTSQKGCGWCASSNFCLPGNSTGPDPAQGGVCAKPYWLWGEVCPLEPSASPSTSPSASPTPSQTPSASPTPSVSPSHTPSASPSPSPDRSDACPTFLNCTTCVAGSQCLWCPASNTCFNSTKPNVCMEPGENTCYDEFCATFTTCADCSQQTVCGWCNYTKCVAGNNARPTRGQCTAYQYRSCAPIPCNQFRNCPLCTQPGNTHCAWCDPAMQCLPVTNPPPQPGDPACPHDWFYEECPAPVDCALYTTCMDCTDYNQDCYWCTDGKSSKGFCSWFSPTDHVCIRNQKQCSTSPGKSSGSDGLGGGAIAGIVIGTLCGVAILPASAFVWYKYYWSRRHYYVTLA